MARKSDSDRVKVWVDRLQAADKAYKKWSDRYKCDLLWEYYLGHQWKDEDARDEAGALRYTINLVFPTIESQLPSQLFYRPKYVIRPSPTTTQTPGSNAEARAQLQEDTVNSFVQDGRLAYKSETFDALLESYFRFGVIEVGYSSDWIDNPNAGKPILKEGSDQPMTDADGNQVLQPQRVLESERIYYKRIPACQIRVSANSYSKLSRCDWYAYYEWRYPEDLKRNARYKNTTNINTTGKSQGEYTTDSDDDKPAHKDMVKVWKIFDLRAKKRYDFGEGNDKFMLEEDMDRWEDGTPVIQHAVLQKNPRLDDFYPLPPVFNWISPQDELNETRDMQRIHRKRFIRKYTVDPNVDKAEREKLEQPYDGIMIEAKPEAIQPIPDAPLDPAITRNIPISKDDFREISGVSSEQRGIAQAETATQANIIDISSRIRDTKARDQIADWLAVIGKLTLYFIRKRMVKSFWIKLNTDMQAEGAQVQAAKVEQGYQEIKREDLDGVDTEVSVDIESLAPINEAQDRQDWIAALQIVTDPMRGPMLLASDVLLRKTLGMFNIRSEKDIAALRQFGVQALQMLAMAQQQQAAGASRGPQGATPGPTPSRPDIAAQIQSQLGTTQ